MNEFFRRGLFSPTAARVLGKNIPLSEPFIMKPDDQEIEVQPDELKLSRQEQQEELDRLYREQMRRLSCPGCGETEIF